MQALNWKGIVRMKHAIELRPDLITIRDAALEAEGQRSAVTAKDIVDALDQVLYEIDMDEFNDLENYLIEADFNATFGNGINPYQEIALRELPF